MSIIQTGYSALCALSAALYLLITATLFRLTKQNPYRLLGCLLGCVLVASWWLMLKLIQ